jgi:hypothetical protein
MDDVDAKFIPWKWKSSGYDMDWFYMIEVLKGGL